MNNTSEETNTPQTEQTQHEQTLQLEAPALSPEELAAEKARQEAQEKITEMLRNGQKPVLFEPPLSSQHASAINFALSQLDTLRTKIEEARTQVKEQYEAIESRLDTLRKEEVIANNQTDQQAEESVKRYLGLLEKIITEIGYEKDLLHKYATLDTRTVIPVLLHEPNEFGPYLTHKINQVKKQAKKVERDLNVSFSRYQFSFSNQRNRLSHLEALVKYQAQMKKAKAS